MTFADKKTKLDYLLELIIAGNAGTSKVLSNKFCVSERTLGRLIEELRRQGYQISFCTQRKKYFLIEGSISLN
jgi:biotin operon repressor